MASKLSFLFSCILFLFLFVLPVFSNGTDHSPFEFLKKMQGCHKGEKLKGIHDLKLFLSHFGYLNYQSNPNFTNPKEDYFDEELKAAIKSYQVYYHLNATGTLDAPTVLAMVTPRCGYPDKQTHQHSDKTLHTVSHYRFIEGTPKWPEGKRHLTYAFGSLFPTRFIPPVAQAFSKWATDSQYFTFSQGRTYQSADVKIIFARGSHGDGAPFDGQGGVLAHAFSPPDGRFHYDADERWVIGAVPNAHDVETLALHEIGHLLGLDHSQFEDAIMWGSFKAGEIKGLTSDDIQGIRALSIWKLACYVNSKQKDNFMLSVCFSD